METIAEQCDDQPDAYLRLCPCRNLLDLIANKWTTLIIGALAEREHRFGELRRRVEGISQKVLTANLRELERDGLVRRTVYPTAPPSVGYALTGLGHSLTAPLIAVRVWTEEHVADIGAARLAFDARAALPPVPTRADR